MHGSGDLGDGWVGVMLSKQFQISESLAEEVEAVGEARPPRRVVMDQWFPVVLRRECSTEATLEQRTRRVVCVRLESDSPLAEEFR